MSDSEFVEEFSAETLLHLLVIGYYKMNPDEVPPAVEPVWYLEEGAAGPHVTEERALTASVEDLPYFFMTRNGKPVMHIQRHEDGSMTTTPIDAVWNGDPALDPERLYEEMEGL